MISSWRRQPRRGASLLDYGLIAVLIAVVSIGIISTVGGLVASPFDSAQSALNGDGTAAAPPPSAEPSPEPTASPTPTPTPSPTPVPVTFGYTPAQPVAGIPVAFDGPAGASTWAWNFGDSATATTENPSHTYATNGSYTVILTTNQGTHSEVIAVTTYSAQVMALNPIGYWRLGETSGSNAADSSGAGHPGGYVGSPTLGASGALAGDPNKAVVFNGSTQSISFASPPITSSTLSLTAWIKTTASGGIIAAMTNTTPSTDRWRFALSGGKLQFVKNGIQVAISTASINDGTWHFVAVTSTSAGAVQLYIDGVPNGSVGSSSASFSSAGATFTVGQYVGSDYLAGTLDELSLFPSVLSTAQINQLYAAGGGN